MGAQADVRMRGSQQRMEVPRFLALVRERVRLPPDVVETVPLAEAAGRVLNCAVCS
jgi:hypothetical protein